MLIFRKCRNPKRKKHALREPSPPGSSPALYQTVSYRYTPADQWLGLSANQAGKAWVLQVRAVSQDEGSIEVGSAEAAVLAYFVAAQFGQPVEAQVVLSGIDFGEQITFQCLESGAVDLAFEDGFLHPLADAFTELRNAPQAPATFTSFSVDVVADDDQHDQRTR